MDCTVIGASPPTVTAPILIGIDFLLLTTNGSVMNLEHHLSGNRTDHSIDLRGRPHPAALALSRK